jgi:steroid delta-isomerase-like uncharacterized protein
LLHSQKALVRIDRFLQTEERLRSGFLRDDSQAGGDRLTAENKALVQRFYHEVVNRSNLALADVLLAPDFIEHFNPDVSGIEGFKQFVTRLGEAFADLQITIEDLIAEGDKVVARVTVRAIHLGTFMGRFPATGKSVTFTGIDIFQISDGKIVGRWNQRDLLSLVEQLGAFQPPV